MSYELRVMSLEFRVTSVEFMKSHPAGASFCFNCLIQKTETSSLLNPGIYHIIKGSYNILPGYHGSK